MRKPFLFIKFIFLFFFIFSILLMLNNMQHVKLIANSIKEKNSKEDKKNENNQKNENKILDLKNEYSKANFPESLSESFFSNELQNFIYYKDIISKAQNDIEYIKSIRGEIEFTENRDGLITGKQRVSFIMAKNLGFYLQWLLGENYQRKILFKKETNELQILEGSGIWRSLGSHSIARNALHLDRGGQFFLTFTKENYGQYWFSQWLEEISTMIDWVHADDTYILKHESLEIIRGESCIRLEISTPEKWPEDLPDIILKNQFTGRRSIIWLRQQDLFPVKMIQYKESSEELYFSIEFFNLFLDEEINPNDFSLNRKSLFSD